MNNVTSINDARSRVPLEVADAKARATQCDVEGCDREWHEALDHPAEWLHRIRHVETPALGGGWDLFVDRDRRAQISYSLQRDGDLDAAGARAFASALQKHALELLQLATELERRNS